MVSLTGNKFTYGVNTRFTQAKGFIQIRDGANRTTTRQSFRAGSIVLRYYLRSGHEAARVIQIPAGTSDHLSLFEDGTLSLLAFTYDYVPNDAEIMNKLYQIDLRGVTVANYEITFTKQAIYTAAGLTSLISAGHRVYLAARILTFSVRRIDNQNIEVTYVSNHSTSSPKFWISGVEGETQALIPTAQNIIIGGTRRLTIPYSGSMTNIKILIQAIGSRLKTTLTSASLALEPPDAPVIVVPDPTPDPEVPSGVVTIGITLGQYDLAGLRFTANIHPHLPTDDNLTINVFRKYSTENSFSQVATHQNPAQTRQYIIAFNANIQGEIYITLKSGDTILATSNTIPLRTESGLIVTAADTNILNLLDKMPIQFINVENSSLKVRIQSDLLLLDSVLFATVFFTSGTSTIRGTSSVTNQYDFVELGISGLSPNTLYTVRIVIRYKGSDHDSHLLSFRTLPAMPANPTPEQTQERTLDKIILSKLPQDDANTILDLSLTQKELIAAGLFEAQTISTSEDLAADQNRKNKRTRYGQVQSDSAFSKQSQDLVIADFAGDIEDLPSPNEDDTGDYEI